MLYGLTVVIIVQFNQLYMNMCYRSKVRNPQHFGDGDKMVLNFNAILNKSAWNCDNRFKVRLITMPSLGNPNLSVGKSVVLG